MRLVGLTLTNFCQHKSLAVPIPVGITGIVGPNGSGKSTITRALQFALLGDSGNPGTKLDDLNWSASADGETGSVELEFVADGTEGKLKRAIQVARASLKCGDINVRSVNSVNVELMKLLGVSKQTLEDIVFVMQGQIEKILFDRPADRKRNIHALFGIDKTEPIRLLLRDEIGSLNLSPIDDRVVELKSRVETEIDPQLRSISNERTQLGKEIEGGNYDEEVLQKIVTSYEATSQMAQHIQSMEAELHRLESQPVADVDTLAGQLSVARAAMEGKSAAIDEMKGKLASLQHQQQTANTRAALLAEMQELEATIAKPAPAAPSFSAALVAELEAQISESHAEAASKQAFIDAFDGAEDTVCPTCHQPVANAAEMAKAMKPELLQTKQLIESTRQTLRSAQQAIRDYENQKAAHDALVAQARHRAAVLDQTLAGIQDVGAIDADAVASMQRAIDAFGRQANDLRQLEEHHNKMVQVKTGLEAQINSLKQSIQQARQQVSSQASNDQYEQAKLALVFVRSTREKLAELEGQFKQLQAQRASTLKELSSLEEQAKKMEGLKTYQTLCERSRTVLHYDNLPRLAMQKYLVTLNSKLNELLVLFRVPFTCTIKNDMSVVCHMPEGEKTADRLSGGEKVMLGIAFRLAVYTMFASDLGFMVLDEPTNMLDADRVSCVADMLDAVGVYARNAQMQLIVITHHDELTRTFDNVVEL